MDIATYLFFDGQCEEAFKLYEKLLGGRIVAMLRYEEMPPDAPRPSGDPRRIMHARLETGGRTLMGSDAPTEHRRAPQGFRVSISVDDPAEAERIFRELSDGGSIAMPMGETFWSRRFGMLQDRFGTPWMVNCDKPQAAPAPKRKSQRR